jgi:putative exporter of polyketide antibiotics
MVHGLLRTVVKVAVASLIVGAIMAHFGITIDMLMRDAGFSAERVEELARKGLAWALPNMLLGAVIILPVWFIAFILRPPGRSSE